MKIIADFVMWICVLFAFAFTAALALWPFAILYVIWHFVSKYW